jgi:hypothetical protein
MMVSMPDTSKARKSKQHMPDPNSKVVLLSSEKRAVCIALRAYDIMAPMYLALN